MGALSSRHGDPAVRFHLSRSDINAINISNPHKLFAIISDTRSSVVSWKRLLGDRVHTTDSKGTSLLHAACECGNSCCAQYLLSKHANPNCKDVSLLTPLHVASGNGHVQCVRLLLSSGALVDVQDIWYWTPLHRAVINRHVEVAELLIENGCNVNLSDDHKRVPLHVAASYGSRNILHKLIQSGANVDWQDARGRTALYLAIVAQHIHIIQDLIWHGCNVNIPSNNKLSPLELAVQKGYVDGVNALVKGGVKVVNNSLVSALLRVAKTDVNKSQTYVSIAELLIRAGGKPPGDQSFWLAFRIFHMTPTDEVYRIIHLLFLAGTKVCFSEIATGEERLVQSINEWMSQARCPTLQQRCCTVIRHLLVAQGGNVVSKLDRLSLPSLLKQNILLHNL
jgi:ankyrin repeat protein